MWQSCDWCFDLVLFMCIGTQHFIVSFHEPVRFIACRSDSQNTTRCPQNKGKTGEKEGVSLQDEEHFLSILICRLIYSANPGATWRSWRKCVYCPDPICKWLRNSLVRTCWRFYFTSNYLRNAERIVCMLLYCTTLSLCFVADWKRTLCACRP